MIQFTGDAKITTDTMIFDGLVITRTDEASNRVYEAIIAALGEAYLHRQPLCDGVTLITGTGHS